MPGQVNAVANQNHVDPSVTRVLNARRRIYGSGASSGPAVYSPMYCCCNGGSGNTDKKIVAAIALVFTALSSIVSFVYTVKSAMEAEECRSEAATNVDGDVRTAWKEIYKERRYTTIGRSLLTVGTTLLTVALIIYLVAGNHFALMPMTIAGSSAVGAWLLISLMGNLFYPSEILNTAIRNLEQQAGG